MQYKCETCYDTGSRDQIGTYLDCNECGVAQTRRDLNDFVKSLGPTHPEDVALAIHQRALSMAPKQEAPEQSAWKVKMTADYAPRAIPGLAPEPFILGNQYRTQGGRLVRFISIANEGNSYETMGDELGHHRYTRRDFGRGTGAAWDDDCVSPLYTAPAPIAAPAAANGALTDERAAFEAWAKDHLGQGYSLEIEEHTYANPVTRWAFVAFKAGRAILAAAGPDATPIDAKPLVDIATAVMSQHGLIDHLSEMKTQEFCDDLCAALSGAKGN